MVEDRNYKVVGEILDLLDAKADELNLNKQTDRASWQHVILEATRDMFNAQYKCRSLDDMLNNNKMQEDEV